jgi:GntR family transcriptional regulator, transcriptional repressor for pyruvate dehydrogenase complex
MHMSEPTTRYPKRGDVIADLIKRWIVEDKLQPGSRLPSEKALTEKYQVGKASVREALKSLEVQGLIRTSTGPTGGSVVAEVTETRILNHLQSFFFFKDLTAADVYEVRRAIEPQLAAHIAVSADQQLLDRLAENVEASRGPIETREDWKRHQQVHIQFHDLLADGATNPLLCLHCKFLNRTVRSIVRSRESARQMDLIRSNTIWHERILNAIAGRDAEAASRLMHEHIVEIEDTYKVTQAVLRNELHLETQAPHQLSAFKELP